MDEVNFKNGNADITISEDGTRIIKYEDSLILDYPLNIDIRVSNKCSFGKKDDGTFVLCSFCHENALVNGTECDYDLLKSKLQNLPRGIELAIGSNELTESLISFMTWSTNKGFINNLTVNQGHIRRDMFKIMECIENDIVKGIGISYRSSLNWNIPIELLEYQNTVFHTIIAIDDINDVLSLYDRGVKKVLVLGEKDFGANKGNVDTESKAHYQWKWKCRRLFDVFDIISFDNLALEQLELKRFFKQKQWDTFNQGEHSFYINAVNGYFAPSSRSSDIIDWNSYSIKKYFKDLENNKLKINE